MLNILVHLAHPDAKLPTYATPGSVGADLTAVEDVVLPHLVPTLVPTGIILELTDRVEAQVRPRSGLSLKGVTVFNSPGTIDSDYRGELKVILINVNPEPFTVRKGDRIAQLVIAKALRPHLYLDKSALLTEEELIVLGSETLRGAGGFGSSGV